MAYRAVPCARAPAGSLLSTTGVAPRHGRPEHALSGNSFRRSVTNFPKLTPPCGTSERLSATAGRMLALLKKTGPDASAVVSADAKVFVAGATGGIGQYLTMRLLEHGYRVRVACRRKAKVEEMFGNENPNLEVFECDLSKMEEATAAMEGVDVVFCLVGTTAFPTDKWMKGSTVDVCCNVIPHNIINATPKTIQRFVMVTSAGVERANQIPFNILNCFKVLTYKRKAEQSLMDSGLPYTIFRPDRLIDGPWTSTDLTTLLKADTKGSRPGVELALDDSLGKGEASRVSVAEALLQCLQIACTEGHAYAITSNMDEGPDKDTKKWEEVFAMAQ